MHKFLKSMITLGTVTAVLANSSVTSFCGSVLTQKQDTMSLTDSEMSHIYEPGIENTSEELKCSGNTQFTLQVSEELSVTVPIYVTLALTEDENTGNPTVVAPTGYGFKNTGNVDAYITKAVATRLSQSFSMVDKNSDLYGTPNTFVMAFENGSGYSQDLDYNPNGFISSTDEWKIPVSKSAYLSLNPYDLGEGTTLSKEVQDGVEIFNVVYTVTSSDDIGRTNITFPETIS